MQYVLRVRFGRNSALIPMYNYNQTRLRFRQLAPETTGYCSHCKLVFDVLLEELELKNLTRIDCQGRTFSPDYDQVRSVLRIGKKRYYETLDWLDQHEFIQYVRGNRYSDGYIQLLHLAELSAYNPAEVLPRTQIHVEVSGETQTKPRENPDETQRELGAFSFPPHPPIEENIISNQPVTGRTAGLAKPKNISLTAEEESDLVAAFGAEQTLQMLLLVSAYKREQGGTLKASDYTNCVKWAAGQVRESNDQPKVRPAYVASHSAPHVTTTHRVFKEWT